MKRFVSKSLGIFLLLGALTSESDFARAIINGTEVSEESPYAKATILVIRKGYPAICTGVLITPNIALTAAHCIFARKGNDARRVADSDIFLAFGIHPVLGTAPVRRSDAVVVHHTFTLSDGITNDRKELKRISGEVDIAAVRFLGGLPKGATVARIADEHDLRTAALTVVGYGRTDGYLNDKNVLNSMGTLRAYTYPALKLTTKSQISIGQSAGGGCNGDSGGPAFLPASSGQPVVVGLHSRGLTHEVGADNRKALRHDFCTGKGAKAFMTNLIPLNAWIKAQVEALRYDKTTERSLAR